MNADKGTQPRRPLDRERVLAAAIELVDEGGLESLTMRRLGRVLGVEGPALYKHVANKDEILAGMVEIVVSEIRTPVSGTDWKAAMRERATSVREVFSRHPWALGLIESRTAPGPATLHHYDAVIGTLRQAGFSFKMIAHASSVVDSYIYGFALQERSLPFDSAEALTEVAGDVLDQIPGDDYPHFAEALAQHAMDPAYGYGDEFEYGLDLILNALQATLDAGTDRGSGHVP